jgi:hypothetical protein
MDSRELDRIKSGCRGKPHQTTSLNRSSRLALAAEFACQALHVAGGTVDSSFTYLIRSVGCLAQLAAR